MNLKRIDPKYRLQGGRGGEICRVSVGFLAGGDRGDLGVLGFCGMQEVWQLFQILVTTVLDDYLKNKCVVL